MSLRKRVKATTKNIEGHIQTTIGNMTGDPKARAEGQEKLAEASILHTVEDVKDEVKKIVD